MAYARSKLLLNDELSRSGSRTLRSLARNITDEQFELQKLRSINAHLVREIAILKEREVQALQRADRDGLTGLYNRRRMLELLDSAIQDAARQWQCVGLLFIDLNGFKGINDEYGHAAGDKILNMAAMRIAARVRTGDFVCRYGGDEFVVILPSAPDAAAVARVADAIRERLALPYRIQGNEQHLTAAIGQSMYPLDGANADELLHQADQAMYRLKARIAKPVMTLGSVSQPRPSRRRSDQAKSKSPVAADRCDGEF